MTKHKILPIVATAILAGAMFFAGCEKEKDVTPSKNNVTKANVFDENNHAYSFEFTDTIVIESIVNELPDYDSSYCIIYSSNNVYTAELFTPNSPDYELYNHSPEQFYEDEGGPLMMLFSRDTISTSNESRFEKWVTKKLKEGKVVKIEYKDGKWCGKAVVCEDPFQDCLC